MSPIVIYYLIGTMLTMPALRHPGFNKMVIDQFAHLERETQHELPLWFKVTMLFVVFVFIITIWPILILIFLGAAFL